MNMNVELVFQQGRRLFEKRLICKRISLHQPFSLVRKGGICSNQRINNVFKVDYESFLDR